MHYNDICMLGTGCITQTGNRNLADFFEVAIDNQGRARIVYDDTSNGLASVLGNVEAADHSGAGQVQHVGAQGKDREAVVVGPVDRKVQVRLSGSDQGRGVDVAGRARAVVARDRTMVGIRSRRSGSRRHGQAVHSRRRAA